MEPNPFEDARMKIERGRQHIKDFESQATEYLSRDPWACLLVYDGAIGRHAIISAGREPIPRSLSAVFGDAVHNLRTSLDLVANDLVAINGNVPHKVYFPFAQQASGLETQIKSKISGASDHAKDMIRALKPYPGGNEPLRALHDLDISDKHIAVIQASASMSTGPLPFKQASPGKFKCDFAAIPVDASDTSAFAPHIHQDNIQIIGRVAGSVIDLVIGKGFPMEGQSAVSALDKIADTVEGIAETFSLHCIGRS